jgi:hypothetical protein
MAKGEASLVIFLGLTKSRIQLGCLVIKLILDITSIVFAGMLLKNKSEFGEFFFVKLQIWFSAIMIIADGVSLVWAFWESKEIEIMMCTALTSLP